MSESPPRPIQRFAQSPAGRAIMERTLDYFYVSHTGFETIPKHGGALLVSNHGMNGFDGLILATLLEKHAGRLPFWLGERNLWRIPAFHHFAHFIDLVPGERGAAVKLLQQGHLVVVYPGGIDDSYKLSRQRHRLQWGKRAGFARVALEAQVPMFPVAALGVDDMYHVLARERFLGRAVFGHPKYDLPLAIGRSLTLVPRRVPVSMRVLAPVEPPLGPASEAQVEQARAAVFDAIQHELLHGPMARMQKSEMAKNT